MASTKLHKWLSLPALALLWGGVATAGAADIDFNRDIRPILSENCFQCHGPDKGKRKANLRLDSEADALAERDGRRAIIPGDPGHSALYRRISAADEEERM